jgi:hypothetical protein
MRARYGDDQSFTAMCSCGWVGTLHEGRLSENAARREGQRHTDDERPARDTR